MTSPLPALRFARSQRMRASIPRLAGRNLRASHLYRSILKEHRMLPQQMRDLGDAYVKDEFGRHKNAEPKFLGPFYQQWEEYLKLLKERPDGQIGRRMSQEEIAQLSDEQREQLAMLKSEAKKE